MSKAEIQRQFDYAVRQVINQGRPASNSKKGCAYRMKRGDTILKCPVGWLIPDAYFKKRPEHVFGKAVKELSPSVYSYNRMKPFAGNEDLLEKLQEAHDAAADYRNPTWMFTSNFILKAREVAKDFGLKWNFG